MRAVGRAGTTSFPTSISPSNDEMPFMTRSIAPLARNTATPTRIATRFGMIMTAVLKPSLAPSTNASYAWTFL